MAVRDIAQERGEKGAVLHVAMRNAKRGVAGGKVRGNDVRIAIA